MAAPMDCTDASVNDQKLSLISLPSDPVLHVLSYLSFTDLARCCCVCQRLRELAEVDRLWRRHCKEVWLLDGCSEEKRWKTVFKEWHDDLGRYAQVYSRVKTAWDHIETFLQENCPEIHQSLADGVSEDDLDTVEQDLDCDLPDDFRCSYRIHNGQNVFFPGLIGSVSLSSHQTGAGTECFAPLANRKIVRRVIGEDSCIPFTVHSEVPMRLCLAVSDEAGYIPGQVFYPARRNTIDLNSLFSDSDGEADSRIDDFIVASSFSEWLVNLAENLRKNKYPVLHRQIYNLNCEEIAVERTSYIEVTVRTSFVPHFSTVVNPNFVFAYYIIMEMDENAPPSEVWQLETRHWIITEEDGAEERVDGRGVVGKFPMMLAGAKFDWSSYTSFKTTYGSMQGHFVMRNLRTGATLNVKCPTFHMKCAPYQTAEEREQRVMSKKKNQ